jgi:hypothetical protein
MRSLLLAVVACVIGCSTPSAGEDKGLTPEEAKALIPEAAGAPAADLQKIGTTGGDPTKQIPSNGESLTWLALSYAPGPDAPKNPTALRFVEGTLNPADFARAIMGPKDKDGKRRKYGTLIHPEYITDCTCKVDGDSATGTVTFKVEKVYEGKVEYTARKKDGKWRIEEFRLPDLKLTTALGADGKWVKK